jgi:SHAQKYF class myb-like DNA-binding protein
MNTPLKLMMTTKHRRLANHTQFPRSIQFQSSISNSEFIIEVVKFIVQVRELWSELEHELFLNALEMNGRDWKRIQQVVPHKTLPQIRSHAQKYFARLEREGLAECVPRARAKKRASRPYPLAASPKRPRPQPRETSEEFQETPDQAGVSTMKSSSLLLNSTSSSLFGGLLALPSMTSTLNSSAKVAAAAAAAAANSLVMKTESVNVQLPRTSPSSSVTLGLSSQHLLDVFVTISIPSLYA